MSASKFRFVSPGVFISEIDNSQLPRLPAEMGPVIIGRSLRGPSMRPVQVQSFSDFIEVFGEPVAGGKGGDVWREGNRTSPTYGAYAAQAYLRNSNPVTFIRLAGYQNPDVVPGGEAGWKKNYAYGLFVAPTAGSTNNYTINGTASLVAVLYSDDPAAGSFGLSGKQLSGTTEYDAKVATWIRATGNNLEFKVVAGSVTSSVNFDENSKKYIRSVLNTNPIMTNGDVVESDSLDTYFLGETFKSWAEYNNGGSVESADFAAVLVPLQTGSVNFANYQLEAHDAETGWVVSQHKGLSTDFFADASGEYPVTKLFKLIALSEGEWNSQNLKISIEDIKEPPNQFVKFGSFTVSVRKMDDTDVNPAYVERFANVNLDPSSENYIAKKIGDKYSEWDYEKKAFIEYGLYNNRSKYVRVEMNPDVDNGLTDTDLIPFGFYGPNVYTMNTVSSSASASLSSGFIGTSVTGNNPYTASFALPQLPLLETSDDSTVASLNSVYWGLKTNMADTKKANKDMVDYVRPSPKNAAPPKPSFLFTLDNVSASVSYLNNIWSITSVSASTWDASYRATGASLSALGVTGSNGKSLLLSKFDKFTLPLVNGFNGIDITEKDPFNRRVLDDEDETTSYAYNSVKVAVESIADAEVVEMNLACMPGIENEGLTSLLIEKCEARGDALAIIDLKGDFVPDEGKDSPDMTAAQRKPNVDRTILNLKNRALNSSYGCTYFPWVLVRDTLNNNTVWLPPSIAALGTFSSSQRKTELWFAPAGFNRGGLTGGAAGLPVIQTALRLSSKDRDALYEANVNPIATFPAEGIVIFGQKTLQVTPSALDRINVRRLMIYVKKEISRFATTVLFDPNVEVTWKRFTNLVNPFLGSVQSRFGLSEYKVVLDRTTTTPDLIDRNVVYAKILLKPTRAIEFIAIDFVITNTGASFND
jgi:hypothetical protein